MIEDNPQSYKVLYGMVTSLINQIKGFQTEFIKIKRDMNEEIEKQLNARLGDHIKQVEGALTEVILQKKILFDKGLITREELTGKYEELRRKKDGR